MPPVEIPWPLNAAPGRWLGEGQGDLINAYAAKVGDVIRFRRTPGLTRTLTLPSPLDRTPRGQLAVDTALVHVWDDQARALKVTGDVALAGAIAGADPVTMAVNNRQAGRQIVVVSEGEGAQVIDLTAETVAPYPPQLSTTMSSMNSVEYSGGYFFFSRENGEIWASDLQSLDIPDSSFGVAEYVADRLLRLKSAGSMLVALGTESTEFWVDMATSPFPFRRQAAIDVGLIGKWAVAGGANVWENGLIWVAGDCTVRQLNGMAAARISTDDVARDIRAWRDTPDLLTAQVYTFEQQAIWSLSSPTWTWEYNLVTGAWHRRDSYYRTIWRAAFATRFNHRWMAQSWFDGCLYDIDNDAFGEDGERMRFRVESAPLKQFPANFRLPSIDIDMTVGVGRTGRPSPYETEPVVMVSWSHNGGANWSNPVARSLGAEGRYSTKITVNNLGRSTTQGTRIRLDVTDPVLVSMQSAVSTRTRVSRPRAVNQ